MAGSELEKINNKYDIVVQPVTKEKKGLSFTDVVVTPFMVASPLITPIVVGMGVHWVLGVLITPVAFFASGIWSTFRSMKAQYDTTQHHEELMSQARNKYSGRDLLVPVFPQRGYSNNNSPFSSPLMNNIKSMLSTYIKKSDKIEYQKPKVGFGKLLKSLFFKQKTVHMVEENGWAVASIYKYRFMRLVEVEEHVFISPEIEWEKGFTLCVEIED